jgi:hypothetical protein
MIPRFLRHALLALLLLVGRSELVLHDAQHWAPQLKDHPCTLCVQHASQAQIIGKAEPYVATPGRQEQARIALFVSRTPPAPRAYRSRAPPRHFV